MATLLSLALGFAQTLATPAPARAQGTQFFGQEAPPPRPAAPAVRRPPTSRPAPPPAAAPPAAASNLDVFLLMDVSASMSSRVQGRPYTRLDGAKSALARFLEELPAGARLQFWTFSTTVKERPPPPGGGASGGFEDLGAPGSAARAHYLAQARALKTEGGTNLYMALARAFQRLRETQPQAAGRRRALVVLADGQDDEASGVTLADALAAKAAAGGVSVGAVGVGIPQGSPFQETLCKIAPACRFTDDTSELSQILIQLANR